MTAQEHNLPLTAAQQTEALVDNTLTPTLTAYICDRAILQKFLDEKFPEVHDFKISVRANRLDCRKEKDVIS